MNRDWRALIRQPLTLSLLLHGGLALSLLVFARHLTPELPPAPAVLKTTLVSRSAVVAPAAPPPAVVTPLPEPVHPPTPPKPEPVKPPVEPPKKPKVEEKPKPPAPVKKEPPKPVEPAPKEKPKPEKPVKEPLLPKGKGEKSEPPKPEKKSPEIKPEPKPLNTKEHVKAEEKAKPAEKPSKDKAAPKKPEKAKEPEPAKKPEKTPEKKPEPVKVPEKVPEKDKAKPEKKPEPKKLQPVFDASEFDREMQSVQGQLKSQERDRLKKAAEANAKAEADRLAAEEQRLADQKRARELAALIEKYKKQIEDRIYARLNLPPQSTPGQFTEVRIIVIPGGEVINVLKLKGSGNQAFDDSVMAAIRKASPLPVPSDAEVFNDNFRTFSMRIRNKD
ncbi:MAG TPA: cell envelope integrity protein TolA [Fluviicoccus sp.]|nr:cell envelope integrity protein TolA [Fluviicoccus sp.]